MSADNLLQQLNKVKSTGKGRWLACCPSHSDKTASLSIRELDDGRVLIHCFAGCSIHEIVSAVSLELSDLFPLKESGEHYVKGERRPFPATDVLRAIAFETSLVAVACANILSGYPFTQADRDRLFVAAGRIQAALTAAGVDR